MRYPLVHLFLKEVRQLLPVLVLWSAVLVIGYISHFATVRFDEHSFAQWCSDFCEPGLNVESMLFVIISAVFYIITAFSLFPREHDEATIDFLHALPVSRVSIFLTKCLAAWVSVSVITSMSYVLDYALLALNTQSIDGKAYPQVMATQAIRDTLFAYVIVAHGVFLSRFRTPGLIAYALYFLGLIWWENSQGGAGLLNIFSFYTNQYAGEKLILHWQTIIPHLAFATGVYFFAFLLWSRTESRVVQRLNSRGGSRWLSAVAATLAFLLLSGVVAGRFVASGVVGGQAVETTDHYQFIYRSTSETTVKALSTQADADYRALIELLGTDQTPAIVADLTANKSHVAGLAVWKKIQMDIGDGQTDIFYRRVLSHETTHVLQSVLSERKLSARANTTSFFAEGMAQLTSFRVVPDQTSRRKNWIVAALAWDRHMIRFRDLSDFNAFTRRFDDELVYTLADTWVEALVLTCGDRILGDVLRNIGRDDAPKSLTGERYWRRILRDADCELSSIDLAWFELMEGRLAISQSEYPEFGAVAFVRNANGSVTATVEVLVADSDSAEVFAESLDYYLKIDPGDTLLKQRSPVFRAELDRDGEKLKTVFHIPAAVVSSDQLRYQVGFRPEPEARLFFERWRNATIVIDN